MDNIKIVIDIGVPSKITARDLHSNLLMLPATTYMELFHMMGEMIEHTLRKEDNNG